VGLKTGLDAVEKRKILPLPGIEPWLCSPQLYELSYPVSYYMCREFVKLFGFLLSLYSLAGTHSSVQNCTFHSLAAMQGGRLRKFMYYFWEVQYHKV
jgi:hypothetical protein